jgi:hypothetical protein
MKVLIALSTLLLAVLAGCLFETKERSVKPILPLAEGNTWSYVDSAYFSEDSITTDSTHLAVTGTRVVTIAGSPQTVYLWTVRNAAYQPAPVTLWLQNRSTGNFTVGAQQDSASFAYETLHVKYPATTGEVYTTHFLSFRSEADSLVPALDTVSIEVVNADSVCAVPAGVFECVHYRGRRLDGSILADGYYAPLVGFLGSASTRTIAVNGVDRKVRIVRRLASYVLFWPLY